jgi:peptidoglycan/xylan/chitin deacetylase (PgdA/CDA1 family)
VADKKILQMKKSWPFLADSWHVSAIVSRRGVSARPSRSQDISAVITKCFLAGLLLLSAVLAHSQQMAITFDDLPAHGEKPDGMTRLDIVQSILATLKQEHLPPTYGFINGKRREEDASSLAVLKAWRGAGQPLGNHTWSHEDFNNETPEQFEAEVAKVEPLLKQLMGDEDWHWFRYPFLHEGDTIPKRRAARAWLASHGYKIAEVTMDFEDYLWNAPYARCMDKHDAASIERLHDIYLAAADQYYGVFRQLSQLVYGRDVKYVLLMHVGALDAKMLPELLALYRSKGVSFISLPAAISDPAYRDDPDIGEPTGGTLLELMAEKKKLRFPANSKPYKELDSMCR